MSELNFFGQGNKRRKSRSTKEKEPSISVGSKALLSEWRQEDTNRTFSDRGRWVGRHHESARSFACMIGFAERRAPVAVQPFTVWPTMITSNIGATYSLQAPPIFRPAPTPHTLSHINISISPPQNQFKLARHGSECNTEWLAVLY